MRMKITRPWTPENIDRAYDEMMDYIEETEEKRRVPGSREFKDDYPGAWMAIKNGMFEGINAFTRYVEHRGDEPLYPGRKNIRGKVLEAIKRFGPKTPDRISKKIKMKHGSVIYECNELTRRGELKKVKINLGWRGGFRNPAHDLVDGLAGRVLYYLPGQEEALGREISGYVPKNISGDMWTSLSQRIKIPEISKNVLRLYVCPDISERVEKYFKSIEDFDGFRSKGLREIYSGYSGDLKVLRSVGYVEKIRQGMYKITDSGLDFAWDRFGLDQFLWFPFFI